MLKVFSIRLPLAMATGELSWWDGGFSITSGTGYVYEVCGEYLLLYFDGFIDLVETTPLTVTDVTRKGNTFTVHIAGRDPHIIRVRGDCVALFTKSFKGSVVEKQNFIVSL